MTDKTYGDFIAQMQNLYGVQRAVWLAAFRASLEQIDDDLLIEAYNLCVRRQPAGLFPTVDRFAGYVDEARKYVKARENPQPLSNPKPKGPRLGDIRNVERGRVGLQLMLRVYHEGYTDDVMRELNATWPTHDWAAAKRDADSVRLARTVPTYEAGDPGRLDASRVSEAAKNG